MADKEKCIKELIEKQEALFIKYQNSNNKEASELIYDEICINNLLLADLRKER